MHRNWPFTFVKIRLCVILPTALLALGYALQFPQKSLAAPRLKWRPRQRIRNANQASARLAKLPLEEGDLRAEKMQATIPHLSNKDAKKIKADNSVSDMFDGHGWAHHVVDGHLLRAAFKDVAAAGPDYKLPCRSTDTTHRHTTMNHMPDSHIAPYKPYFYRACSARESRANTRKSRVK